MGFAYRDRKPSYSTAESSLTADGGDGDGDDELIYDGRRESGDLGRRKATPWKQGPTIRDERSY